MLEGPDRPLFPEGVPMGLGKAMLQYPGAMEKYGAMEEEAQRQLIEGAKGIPTKEEMQHYVVRLVKRAQVLRYKPLVTKRTT